MHFSWPCPVVKKACQRFVLLEGQISVVCRECRCYLEVEHAGLVRGLDGRVLGTLLEQSVEL